MLTSSGDHPFFPINGLPEFEPEETIPFVSLPALPNLREEFELREYLHEKFPANVPARSVGNLPARATVNLATTNGVTSAINSVTVQTTDVIQPIVTTNCLVRQEHPTSFRQLRIPSENGIVGVSQVAGPSRSITIAPTVGRKRMREIFVSSADDDDDFVGPPVRN